MKIFAGQHRCSGSFSKVSNVHTYLRKFLLGATVTARPDTGAINFLRTGPRLAAGAWVPFRYGNIVKNFLLPLSLRFLGLFLVQGNIIM